MRHKYSLQLLAIVLVALLWAAATALSWAQGWPVVVNFYSVNSTLDGWQPVPEGAVVAAYDPTGVECGTSVFVAPGTYQLLPCEGDRTDTPEKDEGADPGDIISFAINGLPTTAVPVSFNGTPVPASTEIIWTGPADLWQVDLNACRLAGDLNCDCRVDVGDIQRVAGRWGVSKGQEGYYPPYDLNGDGIDVDDIQPVAAAWRNACQ